MLNLRWGYRLFSFKKSPTADGELDNSHVTPKSSLNIIGYRIFNTAVESTSIKFLDNRSRDQGDVLTGDRLDLITGILGLFRLNRQNPRDGTLAVIGVGIILIDFLHGSIPADRPNSAFNRVFNNHVENP
jgi:hypothetical protein